MHAAVDVLEGLSAQDPLGAINGEQFPFPFHVDSCGAPWMEDEA